MDHAMRARFSLLRCGGLGVVGLLADARACYALRSALPRESGGKRVVEPHLLDTWDGVPREAGGCLERVVILDPYFRSGRAGSLREVERLIRDGDGWGVVVYWSSPQPSPEAKQHLRTAGFPIQLTLGVDDQPANLLRALAAAVSWLRVPRVLAASGELERETPQAVLETAVSHWPRARGVPGLAGWYSEGERNLRRLFAAHGLGSPSHVLRGIRLMDCRALHELGVASVSRMATLLGYSDGKSLQRCCLELTGRDLEAVLHPGGEALIVPALLKASKLSRGSGSAATLRSVACESGLPGAEPMLAGLQPTVPGRKRLPGSFARNRTVEP